jgi:hypothetical protein
MISNVLFIKIQINSLLLKLSTLTLQQSLLVDGKTSYRLEKKCLHLFLVCFVLL